MADLDMGSNRIRERKNYKKEGGHVWMHDPLLSRDLFRYLIIRLRRTTRRQGLGFAKRQKARCDGCADGGNSGGWSAAERPAAPMGKPKRLNVHLAVGVRSSVSEERANNGGEADEARSATAAAATTTVDAAAVVLLAARLSA